MSEGSSQIRMVKLSDIDFDNQTYQCRAELDDSAIEDYADIDPTEVKGIELRDLHDDKFAIIAGQHRLRAFKDKGVTAVSARVYDNLATSTALLKSAQSNLSHGVRLNRADKNLTCEKLLIALNNENRSLSDSLIASNLQMAPATVAKVRAALVAENKIRETKTRTDKRGSERPAKKKPTASVQTTKKINDLTGLLQKTSSEATDLHKLDFKGVDVAKLSGLKVELESYVQRIQLALGSAFTIVGQKEDEEEEETA